MIRPLLVALLAITAPSLAIAHGSGDHSHSHDDPAQKVVVDTARPMHMSAAEYHQWAATGADHTLLDVREAWELRMTSIPGATHIPMGDVKASLGRLPTDKPIIVMCQSGARSATVTGWLRDAGFDNATNMTGGIVALKAQ